MEILPYNICQGAIPIALSAAHLDPADTIAELNEGNNVAAHTPIHRIYLPLVMKNYGA